MRNMYSNLSPPIPKLHITVKEDYRISITNRFSMVFFVSLVTADKYQYVFLANIYLEKFLNVEVSYTFNLYNGHQGGRCPV